MRKATSAITILFFVTFYGCQSKENKSSSEKAIADLIKKYPQLSAGQNNNTIKYTLERTVVENAESFKMELFSLNDSLYYNKQIIVVTNKKHETYAIPMFAVDQSHYWNMDSTEKGYLRDSIPTTFEKELKTCNEKLNIYKKVNFLFFRYIFQYLLHCHESCLDPHNTEFPYEVRYEGHYIFIIKLWDRNNFTLRTQEVHNID